MGVTFNNCCGEKEEIKLDKSIFDFENNNAVHQLPLTSYPDTIKSIKFDKKTKNNETPSFIYITDKPAKTMSKFKLISNKQIGETTILNKYNCINTANNANGANGAEEDNKIFESMQNIKDTKNDLNFLKIEGENSLPRKNVTLTNSIVKRDFKNLYNMNTEVGDINTNKNIVLLDDNE